MHEENKIKLSDVANADRPIVGKGSKTNRPPTPSPVNFRKSLAAHSSEILEEVYESLGGSQGSQMYWRNHEEQFRTMVEAKFLTKQVLKETAVAQAQEVGKNIFMAFIQNNGLVAKEDKPQVQAEVITPEIEEEK